MAKKKLPVKGRKCPKCKKGKFEPLHTCPYQSDMCGDHSKHCNCCVECTIQCALDI